MEPRIQYAKTAGGVSIASFILARSECVIKVTNPASNHGLRIKAGACQEDR